jgi:hypothetical protein
MPEGTAQSSSVAAIHFVSGQSVIRLLPESLDLCRRRPNEWPNAEGEARRRQTSDATDPSSGATRLRLAVMCMRSLRPALSLIGGLRARRYLHSSCLSAQAP